MSANEVYARTLALYDDERLKCQIDYQASCQTNGFFGGLRLAHVRDEIDGHDHG